MQFPHQTTGSRTVGKKLRISVFSKCVERLSGISISVSILIFGFVLSLAPGATTTALAQAQEKASEESSDQSSIQLNEKEKKFKETLTGAVFNGYWRLKQNGGLTEAKKESYEISGVTKVTEKGWIVQATIAYGSRNVTVPVPVNVEWADDTPVISVTRLGIPGLGTYSARVLVFDNCYSGVWSGPDYGGLLSGVIEKKQ